MSLLSLDFRGEGLGVRLCYACAAQPLARSPSISVAVGGSF